ncbi:uncharacterized protein [Nicotiana tomentosiformis]|uniref:uncharacterized protein n=1 Tax=Nicotiana tomentosiformis TaxID=4098 RepID=UPI00388CDC91
MAFVRRCSMPNSHGTSSRRAAGKPVLMTIELRPLVGGEDHPADPSALGQPGALVGEKKRKRAPNSPSLEKKKLRRRLVRKPKETTSSRVLDSNSLLRLRDEPEEDEIFVSHEPSVPEEWKAAEGETTEANPPQVASYLQFLVTDEDHAKMNGVDALCQFNEAQQALNRASVLHHETFLWYRDELSQLEAEVKRLAQKRDMYKLLSEHREGEVKSLRSEFDVTQKEHADLVEQVKIFEVSNAELDTVTNGQNPQVQQKVDRVDQLWAEMDEFKAMVEECKGKMDRLALEKETAREQLASAEAQLRVVREKAEARSQNIEDFQSQLGLVVAARDTLAKEFEASKSVVKITGPMLKKRWSSTKLMPRQPRTD